ncbi:hypothetical protein LOTGIDRAFT_175838 [Lottia gigantea]|uniref:Uncharacterized protein n=1 Tax=Lottia gigantea TaxID=225164 RepID=V4BMA6_LOTGI|nr:hypothetical protein LOTGIDRAFT_175838 [Lottia gigantea]ESO90029.1 hypothetical protein LOTGIDRAFT_175838 [Lottia gigantea]
MVTSGQGITYEEEDCPIIQEIDIVSGEGITFLSDNIKELLNRLRVILAAMKEGHRSHRQFNEVNCILTRLLEKGSYEYIAINEYLSEYGGSVNAKNNIEFDGNLNLNKKKLILRNNSQVDFNVENSLNALLGFDKQIYTQSTLAPHKANIENDIDVINIHCNLINGGFFHKYKRQIIYSLPTFTVPIGYRIIEKPSRIFKPDF